MEHTMRFQPVSWKNPIAVTAVPPNTPDALLVLGKRYT
jgi:hypothetical protein